MATMPPAVTATPLRLVVICGPMSSGKLPLARKLMADDPKLVLLHRDSIRDAFITKVDEWVITLTMRDAAKQLLSHGYSVVVCAWNLEPEDHRLWAILSVDMKLRMEWLDVRNPEVAAMIPPLGTPAVDALVVTAA